MSKQPITWASDIYLALSQKLGFDGPSRAITDILVDKEHQQARRLHAERIAVVHTQLDEVWNQAWRQIDCMCRLMRRGDHGSWFEDEDKDLPSEHKTQYTTERLFSREVVSSLGAFRSRQARGLRRSLTEYLNLVDDTSVRRRRHGLNDYWW